VEEASGVAGAGRVLLVPWGVDVHWWGPSLGWGWCGGVGCGRNHLRW
jgi:hypothetical protein